MRKAFNIPVPADAEPGILELEINDEVFHLTNTISGIDLLRIVGDSTTTAGVHRLLLAAIPEDQMERFGKVTEHFQLKDFGTIGTAIIDLYVQNPTTAVAGS